MRRGHRLLGLAVGIPCLLWGLSGAVLAWKNYATLSPPGNPAAVAGPHTPFAVPVEQALRMTGRDGPPLSVEWRWLLGAPRYFIRYPGEPAPVLVDGRTAVVVPPVDEALARRVAQADAQKGAQVVACHLQQRPSMAYRSWQELPAYRVSLSNGDEVYVSPRTGEVTAHVDGLYRLIRGSFYLLHAWEVSDAPGPHLSYVLLLIMGLGLFALGGTGLWLACETRRRRLSYGGRR